MTRRDWADWSAGVRWAREVADPALAQRMRTRRFWRGIAPAQWHWWRGVDAFYVVAAAEWTRQRAVSRKVKP